MLAVVHTRPESYTPPATESREPSRSSWRYRTRRRRGRGPCPPPPLSLSGPPPPTSQSAAPPPLRLSAPGPADHAVLTAPAGHRVGSPAALEQVGQRATDQPIPARAPRERPRLTVDQGADHHRRAGVGVEGVAAAAEVADDRADVAGRAAHLLGGRLARLGVVEGAGRAAAVGVAQALGSGERQAPGRPREDADPVVDARGGRSGSAR